MTPAFKIIAGGINVTGGINDRLVELVVVDHDGNKADEVTIVLDDRDFALAVPSKGTILLVFLGYVETGLVSMGQFTVNRVQRRFSKDAGAIMEVTGKSADLKKEMKSQRTGQFVDKSIKQIVTEVAGRHGLSAIVSPKLAQLKRSPEYQTEESDLHLLTRLAKDHDAFFKVAGGKVLFLARDEVQLEPVFLTRGDFTECTVEEDDRADHGKATAHSHDRGKVKREKATASGGEGGEFTLRHPFATKELAEACAKAKKRQLERAGKSLNGKLPGRTDLMGGTPVTTAIGAELYDGRWMIKTATHRFTKGDGYSTEIECENAEQGGGSGAGGSGGQTGGNIGGQQPAL